MGSYPSFRCTECTRMVCFFAGEICGECMANYMERIEEVKKREEVRRAGEYRHPLYRGYDVLHVTPDKVEIDVGGSKMDVDGKVWVRVR